VADEGRRKWRSDRKIRACDDFSGTASVKRIKSAGHGVPIKRRISRIQKRSLTKFSQFNTLV